MRNRRFALLAAFLVTLNVALWIVPQGLALQQVLVSSLFGPHLMRADVTKDSGAEWRVDRGLVASAVTLGTLTLKEVDGRVQAIPVSSTATKVTDSTGATYKLSYLKPGWRVLVTWPALGGPADSVKIESRQIPDS